jgi:restriction endonuclease Mrr
MKVNTSPTVDLPSQFEVEKALLQYLHRLRRWVEPLSVYDPLADTMGLTSAQRHAAIPKSNKGAWQNLVQWARQGLVNKGWLDDSRRGYWPLTSAGHEQADKILSFDPAAHGL